MAKIRNENKALLDVVRECINYNPASGILTWKSRPRSHFNTDSAWKYFNRRYPGTEAGTEAAHRHTKYRFIGIGGVRIKSHRIAWALHYGRWPNALVDHIDGDGCNNVISNLRDVSNQENLRNRRGPQKNGTSGALGVSLNKKTGKFEAHIAVDGKKKYLGLFNTISDAQKARETAQLKYWGGTKQATARAEMNLR